jgi:hypothetical protein
MVDNNSHMLEDKMSMTKWSLESLGTLARNYTKTFLSRLLRADVGNE